MTTELITILSDRELEEFVEEKLEREFEFVPSQECGNDSNHLFTVNGELDQWEQAKVDKWLEGEDSYLSYGAGPLLNHLCKLGHLSPGKYLVRVSW